MQFNVKTDNSFTVVVRIIVRISLSHHKQDFKVKCLNSLLFFVISHSIFIVCLFIHSCTCTTFEKESHLSAFILFRILISIRTCQSYDIIYYKLVCQCYITLHFTGFFISFPFSKQTHKKKRNVKLIKKYFALQKEINAFLYFLSFISEWISIKTPFTG